MVFQVCCLGMDRSAQPATCLAQQISWVFVRGEGSVTIVHCFWRICYGSIQSVDASCFSASQLHWLQVHLHILTVEEIKALYA